MGALCFIRTTHWASSYLQSESTNVFHKSIPDPNLLVEMALTEFVENHRETKKRDIRELVGKVEISPEYDYKKLRIGE